MKAEHRHELKTNELARWIANFPNWAKENVKPIIYVSAVVIVAAAVLFWMYEKRGVLYRKQLRLTNLISQISQNRAQIIYAQTQGIDASYMLIRIADELQATVQDTKNDLMAALALIKQAEALRTELHYRLGALRPQEVVTQLNQALDGYKNAARKCSTSPSLMAMAQLGVGLCVEDLGNLDDARKIYNDIVINTDLEGTVAAAQAKLRLETMDDYRQKIAFRPASEASDKVLRPQIKLEAPEVPQTESNEVEIADINQAFQIPNSLPDLPDINLLNQ